MGLKKTINPKLNFNINEDCKLVICSLVDGKFIKEYLIEKDKSFIVQDQYILKNPWTFYYLLRVKKDNKWINVTQSILFADVDEINKIFSGIIVEDIRWILSEDIDKIPQYSKYIIGQMVTKLVYGTIWMSYNNSYESIKKFNKYIFENIGYKPYFLVEVCFYLEYNIKLQEILKKHNIGTHWNKNITTQLYKDDIYKEIVFDVEGIIKECEVYTDTLQSANIIVGKIYDFIGKRNLAIKSFKNAISFKEDNIIYLGEGGIYTYTSLEEPDIKHKENIKFINNYEPISDVVILYSLDLKYLRAYGPQLMYMCNIYEDQHFHFHIIGKYEEVKIGINEIIELFNMICKSRDKKSNVPTFSTEDIPTEVLDPVTFYACSRFINAKYFMEYFDRDIYILDADMLFINLINDYFEKVKSYDIVCTLNASIDYFSSCKKFQAGNVYLKNNQKVKSFLELVKQYIIQNINGKTVWTLDQNALAFAYDYYRDNNIDISMYNAWLLNIPTLQQSMMKSKILEK